MKLGYKLVLVGSVRSVLGEVALILKAIQYIGFSFISLFGFCTRCFLELSFFDSSRGFSSFIYFCFLFLNSFSFPLASFISVSPYFIYFCFSLLHLFLFLLASFISVSPCFIYFCFPLLHLFLFPLLRLFLFLP